MKMIARTLMMVGFLLAGACSRPKEESAEKKANASPDPKLPARMEQQQTAINRAAEQMKREAEQRSIPKPTPTPSASPS
jgi:hypothetical protein